MISDNIRKNMLAMFSPRFRRSPNPGLAGESKPRGRSVKAGLDAQRSQWAICWWLAGGQLSKAGGGEGVLHMHLHLVRLGHLMPNNFVIDCAC